MNLPIRNVVRVVTEAPVNKFIPIKLYNAFNKKAVNNTSVIYSFFCFGRAIILAVQKNEE